MSYLYSINSILNIDNGKKNTNNVNYFPVVLSHDIDTVYANLGDDSVSSQLRVVGGTWTDDMVVHNIKSHNDSQGGVQNALNIGDNGDTITVKSTTLSLGTAGQDTSSVTLSGKTVDAGETGGTVNVKGKTIQVGSGNDSAIVSLDQDNHKIDVGTSSTAELNMDGQTTTITSTTKAKTETPKFFVNEGNNAGYMKIDTDGVIQVGGSATNTTDLYGKNTSIFAEQNAYVNTSNFAVQSDTNNVYFKMDEDSSNIVLGSVKTATLGLKGIATTLTAATTTDVVTPLLNVQKATDNVHLKMDEANSNIALGTAKTATLGLKGIATTLTAATTTDVVTPLLNVQKATDNVHLLMDEANSNIALGTAKTATLGLKGIATTLTAATTTDVVTPLLNVQKATDNVHLLMDEANSNIALGTAKTATLGLKGIATTLTAATTTDVVTPLLNVQKATDNVHLLMDEANSNIALGSNKTATLGLKGVATTLTSTNSINNNTKMFEVNSSTDKAYLKINNDDNSGSIQMGSSSTQSLSMYGTSTTIETNTTSVTAGIYTLNNNNSKAYFKADSSGVVIGSETTSEIDGTDVLTTNSKKITMNARDELSFDTPNFAFNADSDHAKLILDESDTANSTVTIGGDSLVNTRIHGKNVIIGEVGQTTTIYGNLIAYSQGSNIISNTVVSETAAFHVHNTGTETALTVIQDNQVGGEKDLALFITKENQDRAPFRIDKTGHVAMGILRTDDVKAWLHINRNDPDSDPSNNDMLLVEDTDNDSTPFIIKNDGTVGIGTSDPQYKLDIHTNNSTKKGVAINDSLYIKTDDVSKVFYNIGGAKYEGTDDQSECEFGFNINWDSIPTSELDTFIFRISVKFHVAKEDGGIGFRRAEVFITPNSGKKDALITEVYDSAVSTLKLQDIVVLENGAQGATIKFPWSNTPSTSSNNNVKTRAYMDIEVFSNQSLGDFTITTHAAITGTGVVS